MHRIVIVGGGAGGLALATQLGKRLGKKGLAEITLVDAARTHVWKPLLHQLAAGSFDTHAEEIEYLAQARWNHFKFRLGSLTGVDRQNKTVQLAASHDEAGREITPAQQLATTRWWWPWAARPTTSARPARPSTPSSWTARRRPSASTTG
jgi:NADH dehydrogenase